MPKKLMTKLRLHAGRGLEFLLIVLALVGVASAQAVNTTTVQGTVYLANGQPASGTVLVSWPAFTTASNQAVTADSVTVTIAADGFMSVNLAPNLGATPAGLYYTAVYHLSDGTTSTEYWVVPAAAQASLGSVRAQLLPAAQAVQTVSKSYVDLAIAELTGSPSLSAAVADVRLRLNDLLDAIPLLGPNIEHSDRQHAAVVKAILAGKADRAALAMADHVEGTAALLRAFLG